MGVTGRVDDDERNAFARSGLDAINQFAFTVALETFQPDSVGTGTRFHRSMDVGQRGATVDDGLPGAKKVQIGPMQNQDSRLGGLGPIFPFAACLLHHVCKFAVNGYNLSSSLYSSLRQFGQDSLQISLLPFAEPGLPKVPFAAKNDGVRQAAGSVAQLGQNSHQAGTADQKRITNGR